MVMRHVRRWCRCKRASGGLPVHDVGCVEELVKRLQTGTWGPRVQAVYTCGVGEFAAS